MTDTTSYHVVHYERILYLSMTASSQFPLNIAAESAIPVPEQLASIAAYCDSESTNPHADASGTTWNSSPEGPRYLPSPKCSSVKIPLVPTTACTEWAASRSACEHLLRNGDGSLTKDSEGFLMSTTAHYPQLPPQCRGCGSPLTETTTEHQQTPTIVKTYTRTGCIRATQYRTMCLTNECDTLYHWEPHHECLHGVTTRTGVHCGTFTITSHA